MTRRANVSILSTSIVALAFLVTPSAGATGNSCPTCTAKLDITQTSPGLGDLTRVADSTYASWGSGSVKLSCDDGSAWDVVDLGIDPSDLESGIDLTDVSLPDVDLTSSSLDCQLDVDDGLQSSVIDVDIL